VKLGADIDAQILHNGRDEKNVCTWTDH